MKKLLCALSVLLMIALLGTMTVSAVPAAVEPQAEDDALCIEAVAVDSGSVPVSGVPDADEIGGMDGYDLLIDDELVLTVEQSDVPDFTSGANNNGYFSAEFTLPDTTRTVFLTGLSAEKVEEIQSRLIASYAAGDDFTLTDLSFIDAEKMYPENDGDDNLCWAASAADMLTYTGWAAQAGFETEDDVFEAMIDAFNDDSGMQLYAIGWFFNGVNTLALRLGGAAAAAGTGGYLNDYAYERLAAYHKINDSLDSMKAICGLLKDGCGIGLSVDIYDNRNGSYFGGHALTCFGTVTDTAYGEDDAAHYVGLLLTDSDSHEPDSGDRRDADNVLFAVSLAAGTNSAGDLTYEFDLDALNHCVLGAYYTLIPYSADVEKETDPAANRNKVTTTDLGINKAYLGTDLNSSDYAVRMDTIESNTSFYYTPVILNASDQTYSGLTRFSIVFEDAEGNIPLNRTFNSNLTINSAAEISYVKSLTKNGGIPAGDYTVTMSFRGSDEAYYYNNSYSFPLKVRDSYLVGDADGSGSVTIMDATKVQRIVAEFSDADDALAVQRGSVTGGRINIMDATLIQRYIAEFEDNNPIGEKRLYE